MRRDLGQACFRGDLPFTRAGIPAGDSPNYRPPSSLSFPFVQLEQRLQGRGLAQVELGQFFLERGAGRFLWRVEQVHLLLGFSLAAGA